MPRIQRQDASSLPRFQKEIEKKEAKEKEAADLTVENKVHALKNLRNIDIKVTALILSGALVGIAGGGVLIYMGMSPFAWAIVGPGIGLAAAGTGASLAPFKILYDYKQEIKSQKLAMEKEFAEMRAVVEDFKEEEIDLHDLYAAMNSKKASLEICTEFLSKLEQPEEITDEDHSLYFSDVVNEVIMWDFSDSALELNPPSEKLISAIAAHPEKLKRSIGGINNNAYFLSAMIDETNDEELQKLLIQALLRVEITDERAKVAAKYPELLARFGTTQNLHSKELPKIFSSMHSREKIAFLNGVIDSNDDDLIEYVWEAILKHCNEAERVPAGSVSKILAKRMDQVVKWADKQLLIKMIPQMEVEQYPDLVDEWMKEKSLFALLAEFENRSLPDGVMAALKPKTLERALQEIESEELRMTKRLEFFAGMTDEQKSAYFTYLNRKEKLLPLVERLLEIEDLSTDDYKLIGGYPAVVLAYLNGGVNPSIDKVYKLLVNVEARRSEMVISLKAEVFKNLIKHLDHLRNAGGFGDRVISTRKPFIEELLNSRRDDAERLFNEVISELSDLLIRDLKGLDTGVKGLLVAELEKRDDIARIKMAEQQKIEEEKRAYDSEIAAIGKKEKKADINVPEMQQYFLYLQAQWSKAGKLTTEIENDKIFGFAITDPAYFNRAISKETSPDFLFAILERTNMAASKLISELENEKYEELLDSLIQKANETSADNISKTLKLVIGFFAADFRYEKNHKLSNDTFSSCANEVKETVIAALPRPPSPPTINGSSSVSAKPKPPEKKDAIDTFKDKIGRFFK